MHTCPEAVKLAYRVSPKRLVTILKMLIIIIATLWWKPAELVFKEAQGPFRCSNVTGISVQVLVTDAIAGLGLGEGTLFKSGQQEAQVDIP